MGQVLRPETIGQVTKISSTQLTIGASNIIIGGQQYSSSLITISTATSGLNGIDTGIVAANQFYYVFLVKSGTTVGGVISLSTTPAGFSAYRLVGQCTTETATTDLVTANGVTADSAPIGQIVSAMLTEQQFRAVHGSGWILADGRSTGVAASKYGTVTGASSVPDLRGMVLRGKNNARSDGKENPDGDSALGTYQAHQFSSHSHGGGNHNHSYGTFTGITGSVGGGPGIYAGSSVTANTGGSGAIIASEGGNETRMRNVTVNHFIKIN